MITIAKDQDQVRQVSGELRAGGTDLQERLRSRVSYGDIIDISRLPGLDRIERGGDGSVTIGALTKVADIGRDEFLQGTYPGLTLPAQVLATPQIREMATLGGALAQRSRCWYYRNPGFSCFKKGGDSCPARNGNHHFGVCIDLGPCVAPHPSSIGLALLNYEAELEVQGRGRISARDFFGDGTDPSNDHTLRAGELITHIILPPGMPGERATYHRLMTRRWAEWPLLEVVVMLVVEGDLIADARLAINGVANIPMRMPRVEALLKGKRPADETFKRAAELSIEGANPLPMTGYKLQMMKALILAGLDEAMENTSGGKLVLD